MTSAELEGIISLFGQDMPHYHYFRDKYALLLAAWSVGEGSKVADMKRSRIAGLLQKDVLKQHCARHAILTEANLLAETGPVGWSFRQSLGAWGWEDGWWGQVSRKGKSLVLRLDFQKDHDKTVGKLGLETAIERLEGRNHMHFEESYNLAWARIDLDWETGEVLIEEIQNDWLRNAYSLFSGQTARGGGRFYNWHASKGTSRNGWKFEEYYETVVQPLEKVWSEAMLSATLEFVRNTLGLRLVYMHTDECGARLKDIWFESRPPKSIYQDLPKRFCFEQVNYAPTFLSRSWGESKEFRDAEFRKRTARPFAFWKLEL
jgi:hypothetical protein